MWLPPSSGVEPAVDLAEHHLSVYPSSGVELVLGRVGHHLSIYGKTDINQRQQGLHAG